jgi:hypothetical protein
MNRANNVATSVAGEHYCCADPWYSCPKNPEGCANEKAGTDCNCGLDERIKAIATAIKSEVDAAVRAERLLFAVAQNGLREIVQHVNNGCSDGTCCLELAEESLAECDRLSKLEKGE